MMPGFVYTEEELELIPAGRWVWKAQVHPLYKELFPEEVRVSQGNVYIVSNDDKDDGSFNWAVMNEGTNPNFRMFPPFLVEAFRRGAGEENFTYYGQDFDRSVEKGYPERFEPDFDQRYEELEAPEVTTKNRARVSRALEAMRRRTPLEAAGIASRTPTERGRRRFDDEMRMLMGCEASTDGSADWFGKMEMRLLSTKPESVRPVPKTPGVKSDCTEVQKDFEDALVRGTDVYAAQFSRWFPLGEQPAANDYEAHVLLQAVAGVARYARKEGLDEATFEQALTANDKTVEFYGDALLLYRLARRATNLKSEAVARVYAEALGDEMSEEKNHTQQRKALRRVQAETLPWRLVDWVADEWGAVASTLVGKPIDPEALKEAVAGLARVAFVEYLEQEETFSLEAMTYGEVHTKGLVDCETHDELVERNKDLQLPDTGPLREYDLAHFLAHQDNLAYREYWRQLFYAGAVGFGVVHVMAVAELAAPGLDKVERDAVAKWLREGVDGRCLLKYVEEKHSLLFESAGSTHRGANTLLLHGSELWTLLQRLAQEEKATQEVKLASKARKRYLHGLENRRPGCEKEREHDMQELMDRSGVNGASVNMDMLLDCTNEAREVEMDGRAPVLKGLSSSCSGGVGLLLGGGGGEEAAAVRRAIDGKIRQANREIVRRGKGVKTSKTRNYAKRAGGREALIKQAGAIGWTSIQKRLNMPAIEAVLAVLKKDGKGVIKDGRVSSAFINDIIGKPKAEKRREGDGRAGGRKRKAVATKEAQNRGRKRRTGSERKKDNKAPGEAYEEVCSGCGLLWRDAGKAAESRRLDKNGAEFFVCYCSEVLCREKEGSVESLCTRRRPDRCAGGMHRCCLPPSEHQATQLPSDWCCARMAQRGPAPVTNATQ